MVRKRRIRIIFKIFQVYDIIKGHPDGLPLGDVPEIPDSDDIAVVEFHCPTIAVKENIGQFSVTVWRFGNLQIETKVRFVYIILP